MTAVDLTNWAAVKTFGMFGHVALLEATKSNVITAAMRHSGSKCQSIASRPFG